MLQNKKTYSIANNIYEWYFWLEVKNEIFESVGTICLKGQNNFIYKICKITYRLFEDESFEYVFEPNYFLIDLLDSKYFQGISGLNLDLKKQEYIRKNIIPTFISERVPQKNREDFY